MAILGMVGIGQNRQNSNFGNFDHRQNSNFGNFGNRQNSNFGNLLNPHFEIQVLLQIVYVLRDLINHNQELEALNL